MTAVIKAHEAKVKTPTVTLKAITISGRQMTLSVYRQLEDEDLIDTETGQFRGLPWGRINYFWGECKAEDHLHVVWQKGDELRRACVHPVPQKLKDLKKASEAANQLRINAEATHIALTMLGGNQPTIVRSQADQVVIDNGLFSIGFRGTDPCVSYAQQLVDYWAKNNRAPAVEGYVGRLPCLNAFQMRINELATNVYQHISGKYFPKVPEKLDPDYFVITARLAKQECKDLKFKANALEGWWAARWKELLATDQLFIAT